MQSTLKLRDSDPHDDFAIAPDGVPAAWADKVLADIARDAGSLAKSPPDLQRSSDIKRSVSDQPRRPASSAPAVVAAPSVDTTFRATAVADMPAPTEPAPTSKLVKSAVMLVVAVGSAAAAAAWQHHGDTAKQMISALVPAFALTSSPPENAAPDASMDTPSAQPIAAEQTSSPHPAAPVSPQDNAAAAVAAPVPDSTQLQSMARDLAAMAQQVEQLKAGIAELKASQQAMARDVTRTAEAKPAESKPPVQTTRPRTAPPPQRAAAAPSLRQGPSHVPGPAANPAPPAAPLMTSLPAPPPPPQAATRTEDDEPVVRPPMPLR
jgi:hypothetical protein